MVRLSALALLLHQGEATVEHIVRTLPLPAVLQVPLAHVGLIEESIIVYVVMAEVILIMRQHFRTQLIVQMDVGIDIGLQAAHGVAVEVYRQALIVIGLQVFDVNLARNTLITVADRRRALRHLYAVHPGSRDIVECKRSCRPTEVRQVLGQHLHVGAAQSQEFNLLGTCGSVTIIHVN